MIRSYFGLSKTPFATDDVELLAQQRRILEVLKVHCQQGGLCLVRWASPALASPPCAKRCAPASPSA